MPGFDGLGDPLPARSGNIQTANCHTLHSQYCFSQWQQVNCISSLLSWCCRLRISGQTHYSMTSPSFNLKMATSEISTWFPVGGLFKNTPRLIPCEINRTTTLPIATESRSAVVSMIFSVQSGNDVRWAITLARIPSRP